MGFKARKVTTQVIKAAVVRVELGEAARVVCTAAAQPQAALNPADELVAVEVPPPQPSLDRKPVKLDDGPDEPEPIPKAVWDTMQALARVVTSGLHTQRLRFWTEFINNYSYLIDVDAQGMRVGGCLHWRHRRCQAWAIKRGRWHRIILHSPSISYCAGVVNHAFDNELRRQAIEDTPNSSSPEEP